MHHHNITLIWLKEELVRHGKYISQTPKKSPSEKTLATQHGNALVFMMVLHVAPARCTRNTNTQNLKKEESQNPKWAIPKTHVELLQKRPFAVYLFFRQLWLFLGVKLMEINSNLFSRSVGLPDCRIAGFDCTTNVWVSCRVVSIASAKPASIRALDFMTLHDHPGWFPKISIHF